jgi:hypothetical protein
VELELAEALVPDAQRLPDRARVLLAVHEQHGRRGVAILAAEGDREAVGSARGGRAGQVPRADLLAAQACPEHLDAPWRQTQLDLPRSEQRRQAVARDEEHRCDDAEHELDEPVVGDGDHEGREHRERQRGGPPPQPAWSRTVVERGAHWLTSQYRGPRRRAPRPFHFSARRV